MVSNASEDFPEPLTPVNTIRRLRGSSSDTFRRLWTLAPRMTIGAFGRGADDPPRGRAADFFRGDFRRVFTGSRKKWRNLNVRLIGVNMQGPEASPRPGARPEKKRKKR